MYKKRYLQGEYYNTHIYIKNIYRSMGGVAMIWSFTHTLLWYTITHTYIYYLIIYYNSWIKNYQIKHILINLKPNLVISSLPLTLITEKPILYFFTCINVKIFYYQIVMKLMNINLLEWNIWKYPNMRMKVVDNLS